MEKMVNWGIIGCARIAERAVIPGILAAKNARLYAIAGRDERRVAEFVQKYSFTKAYADYDALLDDPAVDAVYIPLPNGLHKEWVFRAAKKKKHVLCEKPMGLNAQEVEQMKQACDENGVLLMEAFAYLHSPLTKTVERLVKSGEIGELRHIEGHFSFILANREDIRFDKALGGGATYDLGCYNLSITRLLAGEPVSVHATGILTEQNVDISSNIQMSFANGATASSYCSFDASDWAGYTVLGTRGAIEVPVMYNRCGTITIRVWKGATYEDRIIDCPDNYMLEVEQFGRCITGGEAPLVSHEFSMGNARLIDEVLRQIV